MELNIKSLIVILFISYIVFYLFSHGIKSGVCAENSFAKRRNVWFGITAAAFLVPNFWLAMIIWIIILYYAGLDEDNPAAVFLLLLHVLPPATIPIPSILVDQIFDLGNFRILIIFLVMPALFRMIHNRIKWSMGFVWALLFLLIYFVVDIYRIAAYESLTSTLRRILLTGLDVFIPIVAAYVFISDPKKLKEAIYFYVIGVTLMAGIGIFEATKEWLLYDNLHSIWGEPSKFSYLWRGNDLRARASSGHPLNLGFLITIALIFVAGVGKSLLRSPHLVVVVLILVLALWLTQSRSPMLIAILGLLASIYLSFKRTRILIVMLLVVSFIGIANKTDIESIASNAMQSKDSILNLDTVLYRQRLLETSLIIAKQNLLFGNIFFINQMEHLRQGHGIIDLVNVYAAVALRSGLVGLSFFVMGFVICAVLNLRRMIASDIYGGDLYLLRATIVVSMSCTLLMFAASSFIDGLSYIYWILLGVSGRILLFEEG